MCAESRKPTHKSDLHVHDVSHVRVICILNALHNNNNLLCILIFPHYSMHRLSANTHFLGLVSDVNRCPPMIDRFFSHCLLSKYAIVMLLYTTNDDYNIRVIAWSSPFLDVMFKLVFIIIVRQIEKIIKL